MTEADLVADLARLLREGLVYVDHDMTIREGHDAPVARFAVTARGQDLSSADRLFREPSEPSVRERHA